VFHGSFFAQTNYTIKEQAGAKPGFYYQLATTKVLNDRHLCSRGSSKLDVITIYAPASKKRFLESWTAGLQGSLPVPVVLSERAHIAVADYVLKSTR
jgi:hypothetical protein